MPRAVATWLITFAHTGCGDVGAGTAVIVQNGAVTWSEQGVYCPGIPCHGGTWQAADLDDDGNDELLWFQEYMGHESSGERSLTVMAVANGEPTESDRLALASRGSAEGTVTTAMTAARATGSYQRCTERNGSSS